MPKKPTLALCMIVKPTDDEALLLSRCLKYIMRFNKLGKNGKVIKPVDEICITQAGLEPNAKVSEVAKMVGAKESFYKWDNNFANARNYNFSQATSDYILWLDCDDVLKGAENLRELIQKMSESSIDAVAMNYLYDFDENMLCTVKHIKTRVVKRGTVKWVGDVHEDFESLRQINTFFDDAIEVLHLKEKNAVEVSVDRNLEIANASMAAHPDDPRSLWLVANAHWGAGKLDEAVDYFQKFVVASSSDEERYIAYLVLSSIRKDEDYALKALALRPNYPNAYHRLAEINLERGKYSRSIEFTEIGLQLPTPDTNILVHNPRDYDYNPLMTMLQAYWQLGKIKKCVDIINGLVEMFPNDFAVKERKEMLDIELGEILQVEKYLEEAAKLPKAKMKKYLDKLPEKIQQHPEVCAFRNHHFVKTTSTGKDLVYYCGYTSKVWDPKTAMTTGVGGSEEAVINLSQQFVKAGYNVTVYNNCGQGGDFDGVTYKPYWSYNHNDKQDVTILWRHPKLVDYLDKNKCGKLLVDLHDIIGEAELTDDRFEKIDKVLVKTNAHRVLFPNVPDEKIAIIPNGIDVALFDTKPEKNQHLILSTSSPDRHLDATLDVFEELIKQQPDKPWKLAWYYGWGVYDYVHEDNKEMMEWKNTQMVRFNNLLAQGRAEGGYMLGQGDIAEKYLEAGVFLYPTEFYEIFCISAVKAQLAGCKMVTSDFAALGEVVQADKVHTDAEKWGKQNTFGDTVNVDKYVKAIIEGKEDENTIKTETYAWDTVGKQWLKELV